MNKLKLTPAQVQNFIYLLEERNTPVLLSEFYRENIDKVFEVKKNWSIPMNYTATKWLKSELKSYIKHLQEEITDVKKYNNDSPYWLAEAKENKNRIKLAQRVIDKLK